MTEATQLIGGGERISYTIHRHGQCVLIDGAVPTGDFGVLATLAPHGSVMDSDCARLMGATFAFGPADELQALRKTAGDREERHLTAIHEGNLSRPIIKWLAQGERGVSSNYIVTYLTGVNVMGGWDVSRDSNPWDPSDVRRCQLLLEAAPELAEKFPGMARASNIWARLVESWPAIIAAMDKETPGWRTLKTPPGSKATIAFNLIKTATGH